MPEKDKTDDSGDKFPLSVSWDSEKDDLKRKITDMTNQESEGKTDDDYESNIECLAEIYTMCHGTEFPLCSVPAIQQSVQVSPALLFPEDMIQSRSDYSDWEQVSLNSQWNLTDYEQLMSISRSQIDDFIQANTQCDSLQELIEQAISYHLRSSNRDNDNDNDNAAVAGGELA